MLQKIDAVMLALALRIVASWKSTFLGVALGLATDALTQLQAVPNVYVHMLAFVIATPFAMWRDSQYASGTAVKIRPPGAMVIGFIFLTLSLGARAAANPGVAAVAAASETATLPVTTDAPPIVEPAPAPTPGGCWGSGKWCLAPTAAVSVVAVNLSSKVIEGGFSPGAGLGVTYNAGQWYSVGASALINLDVGAQNFNGALMASLLNGWLRIGYSKGFIGDKSSRMLIGFGIL